MTATTGSEAVVLCLLFLVFLAAVKAVEVVARTRSRRATELMQSVEEVRRQRRVATLRLAAIFADDDVASGASGAPPAISTRTLRRLP